jgi:hypothetical protein
MRITAVLTSVLLLTSLYVLPAKAGSDVTTQRAVAEEDYKMYIEASGVANSDALHAKYTAERKAFLAGKTATTVQAIVQSNGSVNEEMKIKSFKDYDYNLYVKATGGISNDTVHTRFNQERNEFLAGKGNSSISTPNSAPAVVVNTTQPIVESVSGSSPDTYEKIIFGVRLLKLILN